MLRRRWASSRQETSSDSDEGSVYAGYPASHLRPEPAQNAPSTSRVGTRRLHPSLRETEMILTNPINIKRRRRSNYGGSRIVMRKKDDDTEEDESDSITPHTWLDHGNLLRLMDPTHCGNYVIFQRVWKNELPLIISRICDKLDMKLWNPRSFSKEFGDNKIDIINCVTGETFRDQPMQLFWDGFENASRRPRDGHGHSMLLKIKDWPGCTNFDSVMPVRMNDLLEGLPLSAYTHPNGLLNFVKYLPSGFLSQELGTEMQCAYGTADHPSVGTKKLDINIADIVNILVYVGRAKKGRKNREFMKVLQALRDAGCDAKSLERVRKHGDIPGAIWHVYNPQDTNKINDFIKKLCFERGFIARPHQDFVHGEKVYLDKCLRARIRREYNVNVHAVLQCVGDAVVIPAGAPYQVRNIKSCIMIKHDFISLQNIKKF